MAAGLGTLAAASVIVGAAVPALAGSNHGDHGCLSLDKAKIVASIDLNGKAKFAVTNGKLCSPIDVSAVSYQGKKDAGPPSKSNPQKLFDQVSGKLKDELELTVQMPTCNAQGDAILGKDAPGTIDTSYFHDHGTYLASVHGTTICETPPPAQPTISATRSCTPLDREGNPGQDVVLTYKDLPVVDGHTYVWQTDSGALQTTTPSTVTGGQLQSPATLMPYTGVGSLTLSATTLNVQLLDNASLDVVFSATVDVPAVECETSTPTPTPTPTPTHPTVTYTWNPGVVVTMTCNSISFTPTNLSTSTVSVNQSADIDIMKNGNWVKTLTVDANAVGSPVTFNGPGTYNATGPNDWMSQTWTVTGNCSVPTPPVVQPKPPVAPTPTPPTHVVGNTL